MAEKFVAFMDVAQGSTPASLNSGFVPLNSRSLETQTAHKEPHPPIAPKVSIIRDGTRITEIKIQCACGELIELFIP
jgi:hypothetical protein